MSYVEDDLAPELGPGRPSAFRPEYIEQAQKLCKLGATDLEIADFFDVHVSTIYRWKHDHEDFCEALKTGKDACDERVVRSLYARAIGYSFDAEKIHVDKDGGVTRVPYREHVPPDATSMIFWLKNRRRGEFTDRSEQHLQVDMDLKIDRHEKLEIVAKRVMTIVNEPARVIEAEAIEAQ